MPLTKLQLDAIHRCLRVENPAPRTLLHVETSGDEGFRHIVDALACGALTARERANAPQRLALIARHSHLERKRQVLQHSLDLLSDGDARVRSAAAITVANYVAVLEGVDATTPYRERVREPLHAALREGLEPDAIERVAAFLRYPL